MADPRRLVPRTDVALADPRLTVAVDTLGPTRVKQVLARSQERARLGQLSPYDVVEATVTELAATSRQRRVINATGVIVHTNLGRAPLSSAAIKALTDAAGATDVEFDLTTGTRARRGRHALDALKEAVPAAGAVHVVNNAAAALLLSAIALAGDREIVLSRGELVEIGDGFRIPELLTSAGARLREVGTTNRTHLRDYAEAISPQTGFILKVHPSNFSVVGFTSSVSVTELATLGVPVVVDIGSGLLAPNPVLPDEPDAASVLGQGADLVVASGDKLLGGPQAGLMLGRAELIETLCRHPAARALRVDKLTLAALEATLRGPTPPVAQALAADVGSLVDRAEALVAALTEQGIDASAQPMRAAVGGGGAPDVTLPSAAISLPEAYAVALRLGSPAVVGRVERGRCLLDLRAVSDADDPELLKAVQAVSAALI